MRAKFIVCFNIISQDGNPQVYIFYTVCYYITMSKPILAPSLLSADFTDIKSSIAKIDTLQEAFVHVDVMDGSFVPQITFGQLFVKSIRPLTSKIFDVHLMINNPEQHFDSFSQAGADIITFHYENTIHQHRLIQRIHDLGKKAGISIVPSTPVSVLEEILPFVDLVLIMSVNPGFGGQTLIPECLNKITKLKNTRQEHGFRYIISVDGGINNETLPRVLEAGADVIVSGSSFFSGSLQWK